MLKLTSTSLSQVTLTQVIIMWCVLRQPIQVLEGLKNIHSKKKSSQENTVPYGVQQASQPALPASPSQPRFPGVAASLHNSR